MFVSISYDGLLQYIDKNALRCIIICINDFTYLIELSTISVSLNDECESSNHPVSVIVVIVVGVGVVMNFFYFSNGRTICFKICVDVPWVNPYQVC